MNRSTDDAPLYPRDRDRAAFVGALAAVALERPVEVHAFCVMGTHYHLLARAEEESLLAALSTLESRIAERAGRARLRRLAVGRHLLQVTRYIHLNPVEAGLVRRPADWPWSSYRGYLDRLAGPAWLQTNVVLGWLGSYGPRQRYRRFVESGSRAGPTRAVDVQTQGHCSLPTGIPGRSRRC